jgi:hypothetical protein
MFMEMLRELAAQIVPAVALTLCYVSAELLKWWRAQRKAKPNHSVDTTAERDRQVSVLIAELGVRLDADRVYISSYHNGNHYVDGSDILKCSRTHEWTQPGISYEARGYQDVLISLMPEESRLVADRGVCFMTTADMPEGRFRWSCEVANIEAVARCAIRHGKDIVGFIGADFVNCARAPAEIDDLLTSYSFRIGAVLDKYR